MDDVYTYLVDLPPKINEMVTPCADGYTVYLAERLGPTARLDAYNHALRHIKNDDFQGGDVQEIESEAHEEV